MTLPQFRILAVLADCERAGPAQVSRALGIEVSAVTRFADRMVAAGYVSRDDEPGHHDAAILELSSPGEDLVGPVIAWREAYSSKNSRSCGHRLGSLRRCQDRRESGRVAPGSSRAARCCSSTARMTTASSPSRKPK